MDTIKFAGAQIPVSYDLTRNIETLKRAIDYAKSVEAHYLVTPEGALSGYITDFDTRNGRTEKDLIDALDEIVNYASNKSVGLFLGTMWLEIEENKKIRRNQIRVYDRSGNFINSVNKTLVNFEYEKVKPSEKFNPVFLPELPEVSIMCMICNDLWGAPIDRGPCLPLIAFDNNCHLIVHSTNALKQHKNPIQAKVFEDWHNSWLTMMSMYTKMPIITCDSSLEMNGEDYTGPTASQSGVVAYGEWKTQVPRKGEQYFCYTFDRIKLLFKASDTDYVDMSD